MLLYLNYPFIFVAEKNLTKNIKMTQFEKNIWIIQIKG